MAGITFTFRGAAAWAVVIGLIGCVVGNVLISSDELPEGGVEAIERGPANEYQIRLLARTNTAVADSSLPAMPQSLGDVNVVSVRSKGFGFTRIVKVSVRVGGGDPPDGRRTRYLFLRCGPIVDCLVLDDVSRFKYVLGLWFVEPPAAAFPTID